jgi:hypothetical protein
MRSANFSCSSSQGPNHWLAECGFFLIEGGVLGVQTRLWPVHFTGYRCSEWRYDQTRHGYRHYKTLCHRFSFSHKMALLNAFRPEL